MDEVVFLRKCRVNGLLLDTNALAILVVGLYNQHRLLSHKRVSRYNVGQYKKIKAVAESSVKIIVTPQILAEISNLFIERWKNEYALMMTVIALIKTSREEYINKDQLLLKADYLPLLGFSDLSISEAALTYNYGVITDDETLCKNLASLGCSFLKTSDL